MPPTLDSDEALARYLQEQEDREYNEAYKADLKLARQLQQKHSPPSTPVPDSSSVIDLTTTIDLTSDDETELDKQFDKQLDASYMFALQLQEQERTDKALAESMSQVVDRSILDQENPDIYQLFMYFNQTYFNNQLGTVEVRWSNKMTRW